MHGRIFDQLMVLLLAIQRGDRVAIQKVSRNPDPQLQKLAEAAADCLSGEYKIIEKE